MPAAAALAQDHLPGKVEIAFDRYYSHSDLNDQLRRISAAYPDLVTVQPIGRSGQGREMLVAILNNPKTGPDSAKPAIWIDGNVHGNEIQAGEVVVYSLWYLSKAYGKNEQLTSLVDGAAFYFLPSQNPDGRDNWFKNPQTPNSSRSNVRPVDDDGDGRFDEDPPDDLDGDGSITQMWKADPNGRWVRSQTDQRVFIQLKAEETAAPNLRWTPLGSEGIDNDGDGEINEDGVGGDDMNRNWPSDWQPNYVQAGAGPYPFSSAETRAVGRFIFAHPNIAAVQSYHNAGGMILRGPGAAYRDPIYAGEDNRVYDQIASIGEQILPYYRSLVIHRDLYTVHGGFVNWTAEGLGIYSFTNEMWNPAKYFQREVNSPSDEQMWLFRDRLQFGQVFKDYTEVDHPKYGKVLVGGLNKWSSRITPPFLLEEECHRNFAFTMLHAQSMPLVRFDRVKVASAGAGLWSVTISIRNDRVMPTRSNQARVNRIGAPDLLTVCGSPRVAAVGRLRDWFDPHLDEVRHEPARIQLNDGIPGRGERIYRFLVEGAEGQSLTFRYTAEKAKAVEHVVELRATPVGP